MDVTIGGCNDSDPCACGDQQCSDAGVCVPKLDAPETLDGGSDPVALTLSQRLHSAIDAPYDEDLFEIAGSGLAPGDIQIRLQPFDADGSEAGVRGPTP